VRGALEEGLGSDDARAVLFEALTQWGPEVPSTRLELSDFVHGPLRRLLADRIGPSRSVSYLLDLENALAVVDSDDEKRPSVLPPATAAPAHAASTWAMAPVRGRSVRVLLVSARAAIGDMLELALGRDLVTTRRAEPLGSIPSQLAAEVDVLVVDSVRPPIIEPLALARMLTGAPKDVWLAIWGVDEPFGGEVSRALEAAGVHCVPLPKQEGIAPFIDLVRARRG
jgi:hypothetical protein